MVKAVAVAEYLYDSDVATFIYQVSSQTGIDTPTAESTSFKAAYRDGAIVIDDAEGAECQVYDLAGRELNARNNFKRTMPCPSQRLTPMWCTSNGPMTRRQ